MNGLIMAGQLLLGLSILVILHELGHFLAARAFGIKVEKFYLFFDAWGFKLFSIKVGDCEYGIGWLPLGGYVKIAGMIDESMDTEQLQQEPQPWEFRSKPAWQRLIVMLGGIIVNIVVGIFIFWMLTFKYGETYIVNSSLKNGVEPGTIGKAIGLKPGDKITKLNGKEIVRFEELTSSKALLSNSTLTVVRGDQTMDIKIPDNIIEKVADYGIGQFVTPRMTSTVGELQKGKAAEKAGLKPGDKIEAVNGQPVAYFDELKALVQPLKGKQAEFTVVRNSETLKFNVPVDTTGLIGVAMNINEIQEGRSEYGFFAALPVGASKAWGSFIDNAKGLGKIVTGKIKANKALQGPVGIANLYGSSFDWIRFWTLTGLISMALAFMNLLPIPALDGGHAIFLVVEMIRGKALSDKFMERAQIAGFVILICLMVFALGNDLLKLFTKH